MTIRRLSEEGADPFEAELLRSARQDAASATPRRTLAALGLTTAAAAQAAALPRPSFRSWTKLGAAKWGVLTTLVIGGTATFLYQPRSSPPPPSQVAPAPQAAPAPLPVGPIFEAPVVQPAPAPELRSAARPKKQRVLAPSSPDLLSQELALVDRARWQLSQKDVVAAVDTVDVYLGRFPRGRLLAEAELIRIQAVRELAGEATAARMAAEFLRRHPDSPHAPALKRMLADPSPPR
ncbi:MAG TPA: hypothetical protein VGG33_09440 [Polyangia bacterium]